jgi:hypothetical protein
MLCPQRLSTPLKIAFICYLAPLQVWCNSQLQIKTYICTLFKSSNLLGRVWQPAANFNGRLMCFKFYKLCQTAITFCKRAATPNNITQQNSLQRAGGP